jgi:hypothetical protein
MMMVAYKSSPQGKKQKNSQLQERTEAVTYGPQVQRAVKWLETVKLQERGVMSQRDAAATALAAASAAEARAASARTSATASVRSFYLLVCCL